MSAVFLALPTYKFQIICCNCGTPSGHPSAEASEYPEDEITFEMEAGMGSGSSSGPLTRLSSLWDHSFENVVISSDHSRHLISWSSCRYSALTDSVFCLCFSCFILMSLTSGWVLDGFILNWLPCRRHHENCVYEINLLGYFGHIRFSWNRIIVLSVNNLTSEWLTIEMLQVLNDALVQGLNQRCCVRWNVLEIETSIQEKGDTFIEERWNRTIL